MNNKFVETTKEFILIRSLLFYHVVTLSHDRNVFLRILDRNRDLYNFTRPRNDTIPCILCIILLQENVIYLPLLHICTYL